MKFKNLDNKSIYIGKSYKDLTRKELKSGEVAEINNALSAKNQFSSEQKIEIESIDFINFTIIIPDDIVEPKCECGAEKCGLNIHSSWCPLYNDK